MQFQLAPFFLFLAWFSISMVFSYLGFQYRGKLKAEHVFRWHTLPIQAGRGNCAMDLADHNGRIVHQHYGEDGYKEMEAVIASLLGREEK